MESIFDLLETRYQLLRAHAAMMNMATLVANSAGGSDRTALADQAIAAADALLDRLGIPNPDLERA